MTPFSDRLFRLRKEKNLSQAALAEKMGMSARIIQYYEDGGREPTMNSLMKLADIFDVTIDYICGYDNLKKEETVDVKKEKNMKEKPKMNLFAERVKKVMAEREMRAVDLCRATDISKSMMSRYLSGRFLPKQENTMKIAEALHVEVSWLISGDEEKRPGCVTVPMSSYAFADQENTVRALKNHRNSKRKNMKICIPGFILGREKKNDSLIFLEMKGQSMNRTIRDGSLISMKTNVKIDELRDEDIVIMDWEGNCRIGRFINDSRNRRYILKTDSDDSTLLPTVIPYDRFKEPMLLGRVIMYTTTLTA